MPSKLYSFFSPRRAVSADLSGPAVLPPPAGELVVLADSSPRPDLLPGELPPPIAREDGDDLPPMICRAVFEEISVHANGDIVCSCADPTGRRVYGNVYRDRIADVYNGPMYRAIREWQLQSKPDCWCPVTQFNCAGRIARASAAEKPTNRHVKMLQLEPVSHCNLRCPSCPVTTHFPDPDLEERRDQILPLAVMLDLIDQLPHLETLLFYNFGEAFLHRDAVAFLREVKKRRPDVFIANSTNGLTLTQSTIEAVATEALLNRSVFAIDGASEDTYRRYRVGGDFAKAMRNLEAMVSSSDRAGTRDRMEIIWQYILFEWNDSDEEMAKARELARAIGVPINFVLTHTPGASQRYLPGSPGYAELFEGSDTYSTSTCEVQLVEFIGNERIKAGRYLARISCDQATISGACKRRIHLDVTVENLSPSRWVSDHPHGFCLGMMLRTTTGKKIRELPGCLLPASIMEPGGRGAAKVEIELPGDPGEYQILLDVVEAGVCWFHQCGSQPLVFPVSVVPEPCYRARISTGCSSLGGSAGSRLTLDVTVENLAVTEWSKVDPGAFHLGVLLCGADGEKIRDLPGWWPLPPAARLPGGSGKTSLEIQLPADPGEYQILVDVVEAGVCWFSERGSQPLVRPLTVTPELRYVARISSHCCSIAGSAGASLAIDVTVENVATASWSKNCPGAFYVGVLLCTASGEKIRELPGCALPTAASRPGGSGSTRLVVELPAEPGEHQIRVDVVENGVCWFFERGSQALVIPVSIAPEEVPSVVMA